MCCWSRGKGLCHPHSWNVMHAAYRVCFKREERRGEEQGGEGRGTLCGCTGTRGGVFYRLLLRPPLLPLLHAWRRWRRKSHFLFCEERPKHSNMKVCRAGKLSMNTHDGGLERGEKGEGEGCAQGESDVRRRDGGWERLKGRGRKEVHFRRMGGWKKEGTITPMFKRLSLGPHDTSHRQPSEGRPCSRECWFRHSPLRPILTTNIFKHISLLVFGLFFCFGWFFCLSFCLHDIYGFICRWKKLNNVTFLPF